MSTSNNDMALPWPLILHIAFSILQLPPHIFWQMTPKEWSECLRGMLASQKTQTASPSKEELDTLMQTFPDGKVT